MQTQRSNKPPDLKEREPGTEPFHRLASSLIISLEKPPKLLMQTVQKNICDFWMKS